MPADPDRYPLTPLQRGMLFHALAAPESTMYVEQYRHRFAGELDLAAFRAAWEAVCRWHPVLRTGFDWAEADRPQQVVRPAVALPLAVDDWRELPEPEQADRLRRLEAVERDRGFDLAEPPLFRLRLVRLADRSWQLLWTQHHLILDGWSARLVLQQAADGYAAASSAEPLPDPPAATGYREFVAWAGGQDLAAAEAHWTAELAGFTEPTPLGIARTAGPGAGADQERVGVTLDGELASRLHRFAREHRLGLDTLLTAAWAVVLGRYAGTDEVVFGVTWPGRSSPEVAHTIGLLINTVPARVRLDWSAPVAGWLAELRDRQARAQEFTHTPLDRVQAWSEVPAGRRLFDSILVVEDFPVGLPERLGELAVTESDSVQQTNYPLTVLAFPGPARFRLAVLFDGGLVDRRLAEALLAHLAAVLEGLRSAPSLGAVELLRPAERAELLDRGAARATFPPTDAGGLAPARFATWAQRAPDRVAVSIGDRRVSYQELQAQVARLAHRLHGLGVRPGQLVGVCLPRGVDLVVAVLAVACAGAGYLPIDRRHPPSRVRTVLSDASVVVLLTDRELTGELGPDAAPVTVCLDDREEQQRLAGLPATLIELPAQPDDVAYVIYTSGSTGVPKGVVVEHAQLTRLFDATRGWFRFGPDDVWTLFHSIGFDFSVWELWGALAHGGRLVVVPEPLTRDPAGFRQLLLAEGVTVLNQTPSGFRSLLHSDLAAGPDRSAYRLRYVILGGELLEVASLRPWLSRYGDQRPQLVNMYGITETTVHVTYRPIRLADLAAGVPSPIGEPIPDLALRLVDPHGRLVPVGVPGEIQVAGAGVARGYLHRPELTAERFVTAPADPDQPAHRWYRSGDRARWLPDGGLEFLGRLDDQIKIRGYRIEPGEIEYVLTGHPRVREAVVLARETGTGPGHRQLVAYLVPAPGGDQLSWPAVRDWLSERVPDYLVPAAAVTLERLPLTPNRKVDRSALPDPALARPPAAPAAPQTELEQVLAEVWAEVLGLERVGTEDNFFALGGDSILTIQVVSRAARRGVAVTPAQLFAHQTVAALARVAVPAEHGTVQAEQGEVTGPVPATPAQAWFQALALPHPAQWNLPMLLATRRPVSRELLAEALTALLAHHDLLRLRLEEDDSQRGDRRGEPVAPAPSNPAAPVGRCRPTTGQQRIVAIAEAGPVPVSEHPPAPAGGDASDRLVRRLQGGLDLARGPVLRAAVLRTPPDQPDRVLLVAHHLVVDAVSWRILLEDLETALGQLAAGEPVRLPPKTTDFGRWAERLVEEAGSDRVAEQARWWLAQLPDRPPELPVGPGEPGYSAPDAAADSAGGDGEGSGYEADTELVPAALDPPATEELLTTAHRPYRTRPEELLLAALVQAFGQWTGTPQLLVDVEGHGRDLPVEGVDLSRTVGWFTAFTPTWLDLSGVADRPAAVVKAVKEQLRAVPGGGSDTRPGRLNAGSAGAAPAGVRGAHGLARWLRGDELAAQLAERPAASVSFNYLGRLDQPSAGDWFTVLDEQVGGSRHPANPRPYLVDVVAGVRDGQLQVYFSYSGRQLARTAMERLAAGYQAALRGLLAHCRSPEAGGPTPSDFPLAQLDQRQLDRLVAERGPIEDLYPLAPLQRGLLFHTLANPTSGVYFEQFSIRLAGPLDLAGFERAWRELLARHAVLRAGIAWQGLDVPHLVVRDRVELPLTHHDWTRLPAEQQASRLAELQEQDRSAGFDLTAAPLTRLHLVQLGPERWQVVWSHHHILLDGWSVALLIQEIFDNYQAILSGHFGDACEPKRKDCAPAPPPPPYRDYLGYLAGLDLSGAWAYWRRVLSGVTEPTPVGADRPAVRTGRRDADYARVHRRLPPDRSEAVREFARTHRLTLDTVLHGAWALLLAHRSGRDDVVFGVTSSGRPPALPGVEEMVGLFINTLPARVRVDRDQPVGSWLAGLLADQVRMREYEHTPLDQIRSWTSVPADLPLFDTGRGLENYPMDGARFRTGDVAIQEIQTFEQANYALSFVVIPDEALFLQLWYDALRFTPETAEHLMAATERLVLALADDPDRTVRELLARIEEPVAQAGPPPEVRDGPLPGLVGYWAEVAPDRPAVAGPAGESRLTYRQLDQLANQLAGWLQERGAGPGIRIGVALPGLADRVVAMLAILRAGAAYLPLPPGDPAATAPARAFTLLPAGPAAGERAMPVDLGQLAGRPAEPPENPVGPAGPATVLWWRGTAGEAELSHRELARHARAWQGELTGRDVVGQVAAPGSEAAAWETWAALAAGACLGPLSVATVLTLTASELVALPDREPSTLDGVRLVLLRGDLPDRYARRLRARQQSLRVEPAADLEAARVAHVLRQLPLVREAVVTPAPDRRRLGAYLVPDPGAVAGDGDPGSDDPGGDPDGGDPDGGDPDGGDLAGGRLAGGRLAQRHVEQWRSLYDRTYADGAGADPTFNIVGWNSSYTGTLMAAEAMAEWRVCTLDRIRALHPRRVLEIGCGTGLLLFGLLDSCEQYLGTDFSPVCLAQVRDHLASLDPATRDRVTLLERTADDVTDLPPGSFDVVVLNSVVQYFPGAGYLARVLAGALRMATADGAVFLGDVRHYGLQQAFHTSVELFRAVDMLPTDELYARVSRAFENERELLVDPGYLTAFAAGRPEIGAVELVPKRGMHDTELTRYRYDAVLRLRPPAPAPPDPAPEPTAWYDWRRDVLTRSEIGWLLDHASEDAVGVTGVPNARIAVDLAAARLLTDPTGPNTAGELRIAARKAPSGMDPEELYQLGEQRGWSVAVSLASHQPDGSLNVLFRRGEAATAPVPGDLPAAAADGAASVHGIAGVHGAAGVRGIAGVHGAASADGVAGEPRLAADRPLTSGPLRGSLASELEREAWQALAGSLPEHLRVSQVLVLDELPRNPDGDVDESALPVPAPDSGAEPTPVAAGAVPPRTADELRLARIWEQALRVRSVDVRASFFDLGGDSLLAIRVIDEVTRVFGRQVPLAVLLQEPTIEGMAAALRAEPGPRSPLVELTAGTGLPFVCVNPAGGSVLWYAELARQLGPGRPFYALQARGVDGCEPPDLDVSTIASWYLASLRERQPHGPYLLGGYSMGGLLAYEMAQQLRTAGEPVGLLVLLDTPAPALMDELPDQAAVLGLLLGGLIELDLAELRAMPAEELLPHVLAEAERAELLPPGQDPDRAARQFQAYTAQLVAARRYQPRPYPGPACLLRAARSRLEPSGYGWDGLLTGEWETVEVPGDHESMIRPPHVQRLADVLQARLAAVSPG